MKQQIYQQIANKQVQEVLNKQREQETASLMADFNSWQQQRQDPAQLMADFDAWKQQNTPQVQPQEVRQTIPSIADVQPVVHEQTEMEKHIAEVTKAAKEKRLRERAQKLQQLEQIEASQPYTKKERETLAKVEDISKKLTNIIPETEALNTVTKTWKRGQRPEATDTSSQVAARVTNEKKPEIDTTNVPVDVDRWLSPDTKLTDAEKKKAKEYASAELQKVKYGPNKQPLLNTPEERQHYADMVNLINKTNGFTNFMSGAIEIPYNLADMVSDGARSVGNQLGGLGAAITDKLGVTEGATQRHNEEVEKANQFADQNEANMRQSFKNAQTQNPGAYTTGKIAGQTGMYMLTNPVFDGIAAGAGVESELAKFFINQGAQNVQDLVLDTAPTVRQLMEDGSTPEEVKREALNNILWNVAGNAVMGGLGAWAGNRAARKASDEAFRENVRAGADRLSQLANEQIPGIEDVDNVVRNATRQAETAAQNIENLNKQIPNLPDYVTGAPTGAYDVNTTLKSFNDMDKDLNNLGKIHNELGKEIDSINDPTLKEEFKNLNDTYSRMLDKSLQDGGVPASEWDEITEAYSKANKELRESAENYIKQNSFGPDIDNALNDIQSFIDGFSGEKELHKELTDSLDEVKNAIRNGGDIEGARAKLDNALNSAAEIVQQDNDSLLGDITSEAFQKVKSATDGSVIRLNKSVLKDALGDDAIFSDLNNMVYTGKGSIKFREGSGVPIDSIYNELRGLSDYELPEAHTEADQVAAIAKYISDVKAKNITPDNSAINEVKRLGTSLDEGIGNYNPNKVMAESANFNKPVSESIDPEDFESIKNGNYYLEEKMPYKGAVIEDGKSRVVTNSAINADIIDADQLKNDPVIQEIAKYQKHKNDVTFAEAMDRVSLDGNKWKKDYINGTKTIDGDTDVDTVMLLMQDINKKLDKTTNQKTIERLTAQKNTLLSKLREYGTKSGQGIQAFAKWNDTADGALLNAQKFMDDAVKNWGTTNVKQHTSNSRIAKALADMGHKNIPTEKPVLDHDQIKSGIIAELEKEFGSIDSYFNDEDIEFLTNLAEDKSIPLWQITDEIEHKLNHGTFYPIEKEVVEKFEGNSRLANILKSMGDKTTPETKAPLSHDEIKKGIINELQREFADMEAQFTDSDIEFLTRLVEDKSVKNWQIADEISHKLEHGTWYSLDESLPENTIKNTQVSNILDNMYKDKKIAKPKKEMTIGELLTGIKNSFEADPISSSKNFTDDDYYFVAQMLQNKVPRWQIEDELLHRIEHGTWYTLDESIAQKPVKNKQVSNMLDNIINGKKTAKAKKEMTIGELLTGIKNAFEDEPISTAKKFTDDDYYFLAQMMQENVPRWKIEDELAHRIQHGEWYTLDESLPVKQPTNKKLQTALNSLVGEQVRAEKPAPSLAQIREEVKNTLDKEFAELDETARLFGDDDIDYLANLINNGASEKDIADALNHKFATGKFGISSKTMKQVNDIFKQIENYDPNSKQFVEGQAEALRLLANEILPDATAMEKFEAWRYLAMLGNPKTMLRNFVGNATFNAVTGVSNNVAAVAEAGIDRAVKALGGEGIQRTKAVLNPKKDAGLIKASWNDADASRYRQIIGSKYEKMSKDTLRKYKSVFNSKLAQLYEKATDAGISDYTAVKTKYSTSLAGYLKANGYDTNIFKAEDELARLKNLGESRLLSSAEKAKIESLTKDVEALEKARDYALKQAEYATFHEDNKMANILSEWSRSSKERGTGIGHVLIEGMIPFKKTPANVLKSGAQYSPLGIVDSFIKTKKLIYENTGKRAGNLADTYINKKGKEVARTFASDVIDSWAKTLTGTGLTALGFYLYNKGALHSSDPDTKYQDELEGHQNYALEINGKSYTIDWAAPTVMPLMVGAEIAKVWNSTGKEDSDFYDHINEYLETANRLADPLVETSMLSGVKDTLDTAANFVRNNEAINIIPLLGYNLATGYATQAVPTIGGQIARTIDPTRRSTYTDKEGFVGVVDKQIKKQMNKIPGLSYRNQEFIDTYGRTQNNSPFNNPIGNLAYQMFSPGYLNNINETGADRISREAYAVGKNENTLPKWQSKFKDAEGKRVSPEDFKTASQAYGKANYEIRDALSNDDWFNSLDASQKEEVVKSVNTIAEHTGNAAIDPEYDKNSKPYQAYKQGGIPGLLDYYKDQQAGAKAKESGLGATSKAYKEIKEDVKNGNTEAAETKITDAQKITNAGINSYGYGAFKANKSRITNTDDWIKQYNAIDSLGTGKAKSDGFVNQDEFLAWVKKNGYSETQAANYAKLYGTWKKVPYIKKDGTWGFH